MLPYFASNRPQRLRLALVQMPRWFIDVPPYSLAVLTGATRARKFSVVQKDYDLALHYYLSEDERAEWQNTAERWSQFELVSDLLNRVPDFIEWCVDDLLAGNPDVVGFSLKCLSTIFTYAVAHRLKERSPKIFIILGGPEVSAAEISFLEQHPFIDAVCRQEADISFPSFLEKFEAAGMQPQKEAGFIYRSTDGTIVDCGRIVTAPTTDQVQMADYSDYNFSLYPRPNTFSMLMSRGCINRCSFCSEAPSFLKYRALGASKLIAEIHHHIATTNVAYPPRIFFNDSLMNGDLDILGTFAEALINEPIPGLAYGGMMLIRKNMSPELIERVARSGCDNIFFGLETGSEAMIQIMRKKFRLEDAERILKSAHDAGICVSIGIIIGHPGETEEEFYNTIEFLSRNCNNIDKMSFNIMEMYGDSDVTRNPQKYGVVITTPQDWTSDGGRNTLRLRQMRRDIAQIIFHGKAADVSAIAGRERFLNNPGRWLEGKVAEAQAQCGDVLALLKRLYDAQPLLLEHDKGRGVVERMTIDGSGGTTVVGWALDPKAEQPARHVLVFDGKGQAVGYSRPDQPRPDVARAFEQPAFGVSGWVVDVSFVGEDLYTVVVDSDSSRAFLPAGQLVPNTATGRFGPFILPPALTTCTEMVIG